MDRTRADTSGEDRNTPFTCHRCGSCCTDLKRAWSSTRASFAAMAGERLYRLPTAGGLRVFAWNARAFPAEDLAPLVCLADRHREQLVALAYEVDADVCPNLDDAGTCTIYEDRPLVCQAYPLLIVHGDDGPEIAVSEACPGRVGIAEAAQRAPRPEPVLARAYPDELAPALAVPATIATLRELAGFLEAAGVVAPVPGLDAATLERWADRPVVDLVDLVEAAGVMDRGTLARRTDRIVARLRERWSVDEHAPKQG